MDWKKLVVMSVPSAIVDCIVFGLGWLIIGLPHPVCPQLPSNIQVPPCPGSTWIMIGLAAVLLSAIHFTISYIALRITFKRD